MARFDARLVGLMTLLATQASAEVCLDSGPTCAFNYAFAQAFDGLEVEPPSAAGWPQLFSDGDRPVVRYAYHWALDKGAHEALLQDRQRFDASVTTLSGTAKTRFCDDDSTAGFVTAGGIIELWIGLHPKWESGEFTPTWTEEKIIIRFDTCEAN
jgi:hypothetical protein